MAEHFLNLPLLVSSLLVLLLLICVPCNCSSSVIDKTSKKSMQVEEDANNGLINFKIKRRHRRESHLASRLRAPYITEDPDDVSARKQEPTTFNCKADGNPSPTIEWYKDGKKIRNTGNRMVLPSGSLFFLNVMQRDTGTYHCVATNKLGSAKSKEAILSLPSPTKSPPAPGPPPPPPPQVSRVPVQYASGSNSQLGGPVGVDRRYPSFMSEVTNQSYQPPAHFVPESHHNHNHHPFLVEKDNRNGHFQDPFKQSWLIIIIALTVMFILSSAVLIFLMRQRSAKKRPIQQHIITTTIPKNNSLENTCSLIHEAVWMDVQQQQQNTSLSSSVKKNQLKSSSGMNCSPLVPTTNSKLIKTSWSPPSKQSATPSHQHYHHSSILNYEMHPTYEEAGGGNNDYAEVNDGHSQHFSTFGAARRNGSNATSNGNNGNSSDQRGQLCHSPGPYATTNLINITSNPYQQHYYNPSGSRAAHYMKNISCPSPSPSQSKQQAIS